MALRGALRGNRMKSESAVLAARIAASGRFWTGRENIFPNKSFAVKRPDRYPFHRNRGFG